MNGNRISELLMEADRVPEPPDCREKVMARILAPQPRQLNAWVYACAALVLIAIIGMLLTQRPGRNGLAPRAIVHSPVLRGWKERTKPQATRPPLAVKRRQRDVFKAITRLEAHSSRDASEDGQKKETRQP